MASANNTIKTRIQLKSDTEANWNKAGPKDGSAGFVPLSGELIVYSADATHPFSRLKVGDGATNVVNLPFIDAGTLNGTEVELVKRENFQAFPSPGQEDKLYVDLSTNRIYHFAVGSGYTQLSNFDYNITKTTVSTITRWRPGVLTSARLENNKLIITNGSLPELLYLENSVVSNLTKVVNEE